MVEQQSKKGNTNRPLTTKASPKRFLPPHTHAHAHTYTYTHSGQGEGVSLGRGWVDQPLGAPYLPPRWREEGGGGCNFGCDDCEKFLDAVRSTLQVIGNGLAWLLHRYPGLCGFGGSPV